MTTKHIIIVGGGTAGWLAACLLAKHLNADKTLDGIQITLVESPDIPIIGVGEGTVPTMRQTLKMIGISETDFIRECDATFKQSIDFIDWLHLPHNGKSHSYYHLFNYPTTPGFDTTPYWLLGNYQDKLRYADAVSVQARVCDLGLGPKKITSKEFEGITEYAYHLDAGKFSQMLHRHATEKLHVKHILANVTKVNIAESGDITSIDTDRAGTLAGDFFIDCTGFNSLLLGQALGVNFIDKSSTLFVDNAVVMQVPYESEHTPIASCTLSTAKEAGWIWDIGLSKRRGIGYVYSSAYTDHERAETVLRDYVGKAAEPLKTRRIPMRIGYREKFWKNNCIAIGLSAGFVEPLEATALLLVEATCKTLADQFPYGREAMGNTAKKLNHMLQYGWDRVIDFIKLHYHLTQRTDNPFWIDNADRKTAPDTLLEKLDHWRFHPPSENDFFSKYEVFRLENYQYILYGMNFATQLQNTQQRYPRANDAHKAFKNIETLSENTIKKLVKHRDLINQIKNHRMHNF